MSLSFTISALKHNLWLVYFDATPSNTAIVHWFKASLDRHLKRTPLKTCEVLIIIFKQDWSLSRRLPFLGLIPGHSILLEIMWVCVVSTLGRASILNARFNWIPILNCDAHLLQIVLESWVHWLALLTARGGRTVFVWVYKQERMLVLIASRPFVFRA